MNWKIPEFDRERFNSEEVFKGYIVLPEPKPFKELFKDQELSLVEIVLCATNPLYCGFVGAFSYHNNKVIPLDYDSYSDEMLVYAYNEFVPRTKIEGIEKGLTIVSNTF